MDAQMWCRSVSEKSLRMLLCMRLTVASHALFTLFLPDCGYTPPGLRKTLLKRFISSKCARARCRPSEEVGEAAVLWHPIAVYEFLYADRIRLYAQYGMWTQPERVEGTKHSA
jgi:hypothetical protein